MESTKKYNSGNENHSSQEGTTELDNLLKKRKVKFIIFPMILYLQQNKIILITLIIKECFHSEYIKLIIFNNSIFKNPNSNFILFVSLIF